MAKSKRATENNAFNKEIVVDAHDAREQAMRWHYYLEDRFRFPFRAKCLAQWAISPSPEGQEVETAGLHNIPFHSIPLLCQFRAGFLSCTNTGTSYSCRRYSSKTH